mmetsp:Transcript_16935/g.45922  ORF Transcript_16935/g.45922 Transcript_16935/m.45922 type:complete len:243 (+) Transcript_16935:1091-1819(+)
MATTTLSNPCETQRLLVLEAPWTVRRVCELYENDIARHPAFHRLHNISSVLPQCVDLVHNEHWHPRVLRNCLDLGEKGTFRPSSSVAELILVNPRTTKQVRKHTTQCTLARAHQTRHHETHLSSCISVQGVRCWFHNLMNLLRHDTADGAGESRRRGQWHGQRQQIFVRRLARCRRQARSAAVPVIMLMVKEALLDLLRVGAHDTFRRHPATARGTQLDRLRPVQTHSLTVRYINIAGSGQQ